MRLRLYRHGCKRAPTGCVLDGTCRLRRRAPLPRHRPMRGLALILVTFVAACSAPVGEPSLLPRPAESIDPRVPVPEPAIQSETTAGLVAQLDTLVAQASAGDGAFRPLADNALRLAEAAGEKGSESWVVAQQALSAAVAARAPVARAVAEIDSLGAQRIQKLGGIGAADLKAIQSAAARVAEIDEREASTIDRIQARVGS